MGLCTASSTFGLIALLSTFTCLIKSDYNLVVALTSYHFWSFS